MSFSATLFNCTDDPRTLNKTLTNGIEISSIVPTESCDILNPTFTLNYNDTYTTCNYIEVGAPFNRSYFITDMKITIGKKIVISCAVDVLQTYHNSIEELNVNVVRQENLIKDLLPDPNFVYINENDVISKLITPDGSFKDIFGSNIGKHVYVLGLNGSPNTHASDIEGFTLLTGEPADWAMRYIFYWVNIGTQTEPQMVSIGELISQGVVPQGVSYNDMVAGYGGVYSKNL